MGTTLTPQQEWEQAKPLTPQEEWDSAKPEAVPSVPADPRKLTQGLIYSQTLNVSPALAYDQSDEIEKQMKDRGAGTIQDIANDIKAGGENSIFGLAARGRMPESLQNPNMFDQFVSGLTTMISDLPFYIAGGWAGASAGAAAGGTTGEGVGAVPGAVVGGAMGTFAIPDMIRKVLTDGIAKGNIKNVGDYLNRLVDMAVAGEKGAITGAGMEITGAGTLPALGKGAMATMARKAQQTAAITLLPKLLEGQLPTASDFGVNAALVGALHLLTGGSEMEPGKARQGLMDSYAKDGTLPKDAATKLQAQPPVLPDMKPGLKPAIKFTSVGRGSFDSDDVYRTDERPSSGVIEAAEGEGHPELAERTLGQKPVTMEELEKERSKGPEYRMTPEGFKKQLLPLAEKVLTHPEIHVQGVIDLAAEMWKNQTGEPVEEKSGRGFNTPDGRFLSRQQAKSWVKNNEPEVYSKWAEVAGDEKAEFNSDDYAQARERVQNQTISEGAPESVDWSPQLTQFLSGRRTELNAIKAGDKGSGYGKAVLRDLFVGPRNMLRAQSEQLRGTLAKFIPDFRDQEALTFFRDYKGFPDELLAAIEEIRAGKNEKLKAYIPSMERALNPTPAMLKADQKMTGYFTNALGLGRQVGTMESSIDPERYSPRLFMKHMDEEEEARREGRPRFTPRTPHAIRREYLRILDPLKSGEFEARTFNALDELSVYGDRHATAVATSLFKTELKNTELGKNGSRGSDNVPSDWRELPGTHKTIVTKNAKTGETQQFQQGFYVPQVVSDAMRPILEQNILSQYPVLKEIRRAQGYIKSMELGLSVFHMKAMSIMGWSNMKFMDFVKTLQSDNASPEFQAAEREATLWGTETTMTGPAYEAYKGLKPSSLPSRLDVVRGTVGVKQIDAAAQALTRTTFDVIQRKFKVMDFSLKQAAWMAKHPDATDAEHGTAMRSIAREVNAVYGGLNWEMMGWGPNFREGARALMLAPDWTFSNFANLKYTLEGGPGGKAARSFWVKAAATGLTMTAAMSLLVTGKLSKHPTEVYLGKDKHGKEVYSNIFFAGAPRDFITWMNRVQKDGGLAGTVDFMSFKAAPLLSIVPRLMINRDWQGKPITTPKEGAVEKTTRQAAFAVEESAPVPFSIKDIVEGMLNNSEHDYSYKDFLLGIAGATTIHKGGKGSKSRRKFSLVGK